MMPRSFELLYYWFALNPKCSIFTAKQIIEITRAMKDEDYISEHAASINFIKKWIKQ